LQRYGMPSQLTRAVANNSSKCLKAKFIWEAPTNTYSSLSWSIIFHAHCPLQYIFLNVHCCITGNCIPMHYSSNCYCDTLTSMSNKVNDVRTYDTEVLTATTAAVTMTSWQAKLISTHVAVSTSDNGLTHINKVTLHHDQLVLRPLADISSWHATTHQGQLSLLSSVEWKMSTGQGSALWLGR